MIEIVFGESAEGSLKVAQSYGRGKYPGGAVSVFLCHKDGREASEEELEAAKREYMERDRAAWEKAAPLGGTAADVFGFDLMLSVGDISGEETGDERQKLLESMGVFQEDSGKGMWRAFDPRVASVPSAAAEGNGHFCKNVCGRMDRAEGRECSAASCD
ncbi:MAG: hypothetical protein ACI4F1_00240 [Bariatricus sp.]